MMIVSDATASEIWVTVLLLGSDISDVAIVGVEVGSEV